MKNYERRIRITNRLTLWMRHIPVVGRLVYVFWSCLLEEGPRDTLKPRWGAITFSFLNDGLPTIWHTYIQIVDHDGPYSGIYQPKTPPHSRAEAERWETQTFDEWTHDHKPRW